LIESEKIRPRFLEVTGNIQAKGDLLHIPTMAEGTVQDVTAATGAITNSAVTPTEAQLTVSRWRHIAIDVVDRANIQALIDATRDFPATFARQLSEDLDDAIAALWTTGNFTTNNVGSSTDQPDEDLLTSAVQKLLEASVSVANPNNVTWFFHPLDWAKLKKIDVYNDANLTGQMSGGGIKMPLPDIYGIPVVISPLIDTASSARLNFLGHRESVAVAVQKEPTIERLARTRLSTPVVVHQLSGVITNRESMGVSVRTATS